MNITGSPQEVLWQYQTAIAKARAGTVLAYIVVTTALYSAADILMVEDGVYFLISIVGICNTICRILSGMLTDLPGVSALVVTFITLGEIKSLMVKEN